MTRLTLEIIVKTLFNADAGDKAREVSEALTEAMGNFNGRFFRVIRIPESIPTPGNLRMRARCVVSMRSFTVSSRSGAATAPVAISYRCYWRRKTRTARR